ncbi:hypothetical protein BB558_002953 [Smittium angustum]|uniref:Uncharacterized protein n=1 Tax=Smittium angustum TaxID=133377 RepID=A0A2U1J796_SMIAN|nr:hypothetical protein BB558_002953 [Smittium angustum]
MLGQSKSEKSPEIPSYGFENYTTFTPISFESVSNHPTSPDFFKGSTNEQNSDNTIASQSILPNHKSNSTITDPPFYSQSPPLNSLPLKEQGFLDHSKPIDKNWTKYRDNNDNHKSLSLKIAERKLEKNNISKKTNYPGIGISKSATTFKPSKTPFFALVKNKSSSTTTHKSSPIPPRKSKTNQNTLISALEKWTKGHEEERFQVTRMGKSNAEQLYQIVDSGFLLGIGADPNVTDIRGNTPLTLAAISGFTEIVLLLLQFGADPRSGSDRISPSAMVRLRLKQLRAQIRRSRPYVKSPSSSKQLGTSRYRAVRSRAYMISQECFSILRILKYYIDGEVLNNPNSKLLLNSQEPLENTSDQIDPSWVAYDHKDETVLPVSTNFKLVFDELTTQLQNMGFPENKTDQNSLINGQKLVPSNNNLAIEGGEQYGHVSEIIPNPKNVFNNSSIPNSNDNNNTKKTFYDTSTDKYVSTENGNSTKESDNIQTNISQNTSSDFSEPLKLVNLDYDADDEEIEQLLDKLGTLVESLCLK